MLNYFESKPEIEKIIIFGSRAKGNFHIGSDIDFAIVSNLDSMNAILRELDALATPYKFDIVNYKNLQEGIKNNIDKDGILFYSRD